MPPVSSSEYPTITDVFTRVRSLGVGGNAEVYLAYREAPAEVRGQTSKMWVALKVLHERLHADQRLVARFYAEGALLQRLGDHQNLVIRYDAGWLQDRHTLVLEAVRGVTLRQFFEGCRASVSPAIALEIIYQLAQALDFIEQYSGYTSFVHGDLSPTNVLIDTEGRVRLIDFDVALEIQQDAQHTAMGTLPYISPEQCAEMPLDGRSDLFVLGVLLWELLRGECPYPRFDPAHAMLTIAETQIASPLAPSSHPQVARIHQIWTQLQHLDRHARFENAAALIAAIDDAEIRQETTTRALLAAQVQRLVNAPYTR